MLHGVMRPTHNYRDVVLQMPLECFTPAGHFVSFALAFEQWLETDSTVSERRGKSECVFLSVTDTSGNYLNMREGGGVSSGSHIFGTTNVTD